MNSVEIFIDYSLHLASRTIYLGDGEAGEIDSATANAAIKALHVLVHANKRPIKLYLNSFGGCWFDGMAVYDAIRACPCRVTATVIGAAMSMGSIILQAADRRIIHPHATVMVHDGYETRVGDPPQTFVNWAEYSKKTRNQMYRIYAERSGRPASFWRRKCASDLILTAPEALELGLVDQIINYDAK